MWNSKLRETTGECAQPMGETGVNSLSGIYNPRETCIFLDIRLETNARARKEQIIPVKSKSRSDLLDFRATG